MNNTGDLVPFSLRLQSVSGDLGARCNENDFTRELYDLEAHSESLNILFANNILYSNKNGQF